MHKILTSYLYVQFKLNICNKMLVTYCNEKSYIEFRLSVYKRANVTASPRRSTTMFLAAAHLHLMTVGSNNSVPISNTLSFCLKEPIMVTTITFFNC